MDEQPNFSSRELQLVTQPVYAEPVANYAREILVRNHTLHEIENSDESKPALQIFDYQWESNGFAYLLTSTTLNDAAKFRLAICNTLSATEHVYRFDDQESGVLSVDNQPYIKDLRPLARIALLGNLQTSGQPVPVDDSTRAVFWQVAADFAIQNNPEFAAVTNSKEMIDPVLVQHGLEQIHATRLHRDDSYGVSTRTIHTTLLEQVHLRNAELLRKSRTPKPRLMSAAAHIALRHISKFR